VESFQNNAQASVDQFLSGEGVELHQVALAAKQAELSFDLFLQVRNKVVSAYEEVMRMQV
jgi:flagellar hook-basal body complex protein FliE